MRISDWSSDVCSSDLLAAATGFLFTTESATDLGAGGADIDVGNTTIGAGGRKKALGRAQVRCENRRAQALWHCVLQFNGFVQGVERDDVEDRCEGFGLDHGVAVVDTADQDRKSTRLNSSH